MEILVTSTPVSVAAALGLSGSGVVFLGRAQNIDPEQTVYRLRSAAAPDPATVHAFRHPPGDLWSVTVYDVPATWLWTAEGEAVVVLEHGLPGS